MEYIKKCMACQKNKHTMHKKYGKLQFQLLPKQPWAEITMDFITKLLLSTDPIIENNYNFILVIVERLTKHSHLIPFIEKFITEKIGQVLLNKLIQYYGILAIVISNRDKLFSSAYWKTACTARNKVEAINSLLITDG